jgi:hypothetical protein
MTTKLTAARTTGVTVSAPANTDSYTWANQYGGSWANATNWTDITTGTTEANAPTGANAVTIVDSTGLTFTNITGVGAAAKLAISDDVLLWGSVTVAGAVTSSPGIVATNLELGSAEKQSNQDGPEIAAIESRFG